MPTLSISARFEAVASDAILYDGTTAHRHLVTVEPFAGSLRLSASAGWQDNIDAALLHRFDDLDGRPRLGRSDIAGWRLLLAHPLDPALLALLPSEDRYGRWIDRVGLVPALIVCAVIAGLVVVVGHLAPAWLAPVIPRSWERNLGDAIVGDFGTRRCRNPAGQRALDALVERLEPGRPRPAPGRSASPHSISACSTPPRCPAGISSCSRAHSPRPESMERRAWTSLPGSSPMKSLMSAAVT